MSEDKRIEFLIKLFQLNPEVVSNYDEIELWAMIAGHYYEALGRSTAVQSTDSLTIPQTYPYIPTTTWIQTNDSTN